MDSQCTKCLRNVAENCNRLSRRQTDQRQTDGRATVNSEREHEFTFANKIILAAKIILFHFGRRSVESVLKQNTNSLI